MSEERVDGLNVEEIDDDASSEAEEEKSRTLLQWLGDQARTWGPAILAVIVIRTFIFEPFRIPSGSMVPTLLVGDHVLVTKFSYGIWLRVPWTDIAWELLDIGDPERGDVIVFVRPDTGENYIKRVIGLPGDEIEVRNNRILINGTQQEVDFTGEYSYEDAPNEQTGKCMVSSARLHQENLVQTDGTVLGHDILTDFESTSVGLADMNKITVPDDMVFVMGDNRDHSGDSREQFVRGGGLGVIDQNLIKGKAHFVWLSWDSCADWGSVIRGNRWFQSLY